MNGSRRRFLGAVAAGTALAAIDRPTRALGRTPIGGRFSMHVPWPVASIDPHDLDDPTAALFGTAIADSVFAFDGAGNPYPALAQGFPSREGGETIVRVREGMHTAHGAPLDGRDLIASVERARSRGAAALLADMPKPVRGRDGDLFSVSFGGADPGFVARTLASPLLSLLPRHFSPTAPDGTGAFRAEVQNASLTLTRNPNGARGAAFLDGIDIFSAEDLKTSLRAFEAERDDIGWLGMGLHDGRKGAQRFDLGRAAFVVLFTGPDAGSFAMPGVAQRLVDAFPPERVAHLGLGQPPTPSGDAGWGGPVAELLVDESSPHLVEIARTIAPILSRPGHEVTPTPVARAELVRRRAHGKAVLTLELVRPFSWTAAGTLSALASIEDPSLAKDIARHPPRVAAGTPARALTSTLRVGVLGEVRISGGVSPDLFLARSSSGEGWDLGASFRRSAKKA